MKCLPLLLLIHFMRDLTAYAASGIFHSAGGLLNGAASAALPGQHHSGYGACRNAKAHGNSKSCQLHIPHSLR